MTRRALAHRAATVKVKRCNVQHATCNIQCATCDIQWATFQRATYIRHTRTHKRTLARTHARTHAGSRGRLPNLGQRPRGCRPCSWPSYASTCRTGVTSLDRYVATTGVVLHVCCNDRCRIACTLQRQVSCCMYVATTGVVFCLVRRSDRCRVIRCMPTMPAGNRMQRA